jgi:hypothetical protein
MEVARLIDMAAQRYNDLAADGSKVRITDKDWTRFYNDACRQVVIVKPQAFSKVASMQLAAGVLQTIPTDGFLLLDVIQNMGADGLTAGNIITIVDRDALDTANLGWPAGTPATAVDNYAFDDKYPRNFWVTPPIASGETVYVQIGYAAAPTEATEADAWVETETYALAAVVLYKGKFYTSLQAANAGNNPATATAWWSETAVDLSLPTIYAGPVAEYMARLALLKDQESETSRDRAKQAREEFYQSLGIKTQTDIIISPNAK